MKQGGLMKHNAESHYGKYRIQHLWNLTHTRNKNQDIVASAALSFMEVKY